MDDTTAKATRRDWAGLALLLLVVTLATSDLGVTLAVVPELTTELDVTGMQKLWIQDIYTFVMAGLLVAMGTLGDRIGRRRLLMLGAAGFGVSASAAAFSTSPEMLIAARATLGVSGATLMPSTLGLIRGMFRDSQQRRAAISATVAAGTAGSAIGPLVGGTMVELFWTGSAFLVSVPGMLALLALGWLLLPEVRNPNAPPFDVLSALLSLGAVFPVVYGLKVTAGSGADPIAAVAVVVGCALAVAFVLRQRALPLPLIDLRLLRHPTFSVGITLNLFIMFVMMGFSPILLEYLQLVAGLKPEEAGMMALVSPAVMMVAVTVATVLAKRVRSSILVSAGFVVATLGMVALTQVTADSGVFLAMVGASLLAAGAGVVTALVADMIVSGAPQEKAAAAGALSETGKELGSALGVAVLGSIGAAVYSARVTSTAPSSVPDGAMEAARETLGGAQTVAGDLPDAVGAALVEAGRYAFALQVNAVGVVGAVVLVAGAVLAALALRRRGGASRHARRDSGPRPATAPYAPVARPETTPAQQASHRKGEVR